MKIRRAGEQLAMLNPAIKRLLNPHEYPAGLELSLHDKKMELIQLRKAGFKSPIAKRQSKIHSAILPRRNG